MMGWSRSGGRRITRMGLRCRGRMGGIRTRARDADRGEGSLEAALGVVGSFRSLHCGRY